MECPESDFLGSGQVVSDHAAYWVYLMIILVPDEKPTLFFGGGTACFNQQ